VYCKHLTFTSLWGFLNHILTYHTNEKVNSQGDKDIDLLISSLTFCNVCKLRRTDFIHHCPDSSYFGHKGSYISEKAALESAESFIATDHSCYTKEGDKWYCHDITEDVSFVEEMESLPIKPKGFSSSINVQHQKEKKGPKNLKEAFDTGDWIFFEKFLNEFIDNKLKTVKKVPTDVPVEKKAPIPKKEKAVREFTTVEKRLLEIWPKEDKRSRRWLRTALTLDIEQATADFKAKKLTRESFDTWYSTHKKLPQVDDKKLLVSSINKEWINFKTKHPDVKVFINPSNAEEKEALNLRKTLWNKAKGLSEEEKKLLSLPKPKRRPKSDKPGVTKEKSKATRGKSSDLLGGLRPIFELLKELKTIFT